MPAKEIKELRKAGKLDEALKIAEDDLELALGGKSRQLVEYVDRNTNKSRIEYEIKEAGKDNLLWSKRNISWVYYEYLKKYAQDLNFDDFVYWLTKLKSLELPESEVMIFDTTAWQIAKVVFSIQKKEPVNYSQINQVFSLIKDFHFTKPSESYSLIYKAFHKGYHNWSRFIEFADWWDFKNFRPDDYQREEYNERTIMAMVEQAYIAYSKKLLEGIPTGDFGAQRIIDGAKIHSFLPELDIIIEDYPEYQYPSYFKAKLLLSIDEGEGALKEFLPFAKQKRNDFWVWELIAEVFKNDKELQMACFCKALSLKTREDFLVKTRQQFAELLIEMNLFVEAKTEIEKIISVRQEHNWRIPGQIENWKDSSWYVKVESESDNIQFYNKHLKQAEAILYNDIPEVFIAVEFVNSDKKILNFVKNKDYHGFLNYRGYKLKPKIGDVLKVRLESKGDKGYYNMLTVNTDNEIDNENCQAIKKVSGIVNIREGQNFGFLVDVFLTPDIIKKYNLNNGDEISCHAIMSYNKKKNEWGWKCYSVT